MPSSDVEAAWKLLASWSCKRLRSLAAHASAQPSAGNPHAMTHQFHHLTSL